MVDQPTTKPAEEPSAESTIRRQTVEFHKSLTGSVILRRTVWFVTWLIVGILTARVILQLMGLNQGNIFIDYTYEVSSIFAYPFFHLFNYQPTYGSSTLEIGSVVGGLVYALAGWGIGKLFTIGSSHKSS